MKDLFPVVLQAVPAEDMIVFAYMQDGTVRKLDMKPVIEKGGIFEQLKNPDIFKNTITVLNDTVAWDISGNRSNSDCIDIDPFIVAECPVVTDPLYSAG